MATTLRELTPKAIVTGLCAGILFGSAHAYLERRVGLPVGASTPISILSVAIFRVLAGVLGRAGILEVNMVQTIGSASSSLASGLVFTAPALFLWGEEQSWLRLTLLS